MQESLTPRERRQVQEVNALGLPVTIHLEDQMIPLPPAYVGAPMEGSAGPDSSTLWRSDTDGDLAKWLNSGFTPRAAGTVVTCLLPACKRITVKCLLPGMYTHPVLCHGTQIGTRG